MQPYDTIIKFVMNNFYDLYSGYESRDIKLFQNKCKMFNIEHVIPASILGARKFKTTDRLFINNEPYSDPHILFPTLIDINTQRKDYNFGNIANNRRDAIAKEKATRLINRTSYYDIGKPRSKPPNDLLSQTNIQDVGYNEQYDIYIDTKDNCEIGNCIFQPSKEFSGDIARIVFYFYLMYAYDFTTRPFTNNKPWFANINKDEGKCYGFDIESWLSFFMNHLDDYYNWNKLDPVSQLEHDKNKLMCDNFQLPNIFVGYYIPNKDGTRTYIDNTKTTIVEDLLFGKEHDHNHYKNIDFAFDRTQCKQQSKLRYSPGLHPEPGESCKADIEKQNQAALETQKKYYKELPAIPIRPVSPTPEINWHIDEEDIIWHE
jgi:endonuclease I